MHHHPAACYKKYLWTQKTEKKAKNLKGQVLNPAPIKTSEQLNEMHPILFCFCFCFSSLYLCEKAEAHNSVSQALIANLAQIMIKSFEKITTIIKSLNLKNWREFSSHSKIYCTCAEGKIIEIWPDGDMMSWTWVITWVYYHERKRSFTRQRALDNIAVKQSKYRKILVKLRYMFMTNI